MFAGLGIAFYLVPPSSAEKYPNLPVAVYCGSAFLSAVCLGMIAMVWHYCRTSAYAIYPHALALTRGGDWTVVRWDEVASFQATTTMRDYPHLRLRDGRKVSLYEGQSFAKALYQEVQSH